MIDTHRDCYKMHFKTYCWYKIHEKTLLTINIIISNHNSFYDTAEQDVEGTKQDNIRIGRCSGSSSYLPLTASFLETWTQEDIFLASLKMSSKFPKSLVLLPSLISITLRGISGFPQYVDSQQFSIEIGGGHLISCVGYHFCLS